jgi:phage terminase small subunit
MPRRPVPVEIAKRRGNPGKRELPEPIRFAPLVAPPPPPADLGPVEQEAWSAVAVPLSEAGALQRIHLPLLRAFAVAVGIAERARAQLEEGELVVQGHRGQTLNPAFRAWAQATALVARLAAEFGGSPASLTSIGLGQLKGKSLQQELAEKYTRREASA